MRLKVVYSRMHVYALVLAAVVLWVVSVSSERPKDVERMDDDMLTRTGQRKRVSRLFPRKASAVSDIVSALVAGDGGEAGEDASSMANPSIPVGSSHSWAAPDHPKALAELLAEEMQSLEEEAGLEGGDRTGVPMIADILGITAPPVLNEVVRPAIQGLMNLGNGAGYAAANDIYQAIHQSLPGVTCIAENAEDLKDMVEEPEDRRGGVRGWGGGVVVREGFGGRGVCVLQGQRRGSAAYGLCAGSSCCLWGEVGVRGCM